jgi:hypothetical protein
MTEDIKESLTQQVRISNMKKQDERRINPEDNNYDVIAKMFKPRQSPYDKR